MLKTFRANEHPRTTSREKKADKVFEEFSEGISKYAVDGNIDEEGFTNYYRDFNCVLPFEKETYF